MTLLEMIQSPRDIKNLSYSELEVLAQEVRERIIDVMAINGGHLASGLGAVELTIALHAVFDSPKDRFIFDVGHQCYPHKILTGRNDRFHTVRKYEGLSGFFHPEESEHDPFYTGHAGPALSLALGMATARDLQGKDDTIIPVFGDATLTCGLLYEAFNNIPKTLKNFIIILNDNDMSISKNVGAVTQILSRLINSPTTNRLCHELGETLSKIPSVGNTLAEGGGKIKRSLKDLVSGATLFEQFNMSYVGPIDGHDIRKMIEILQAVKESPKAILLHLRTVKGQGMKKAIENPVSYHGVKPFDKVTGTMHKQSETSSTFPQVFGKTMLEMAKEDDSIIVITPAMPAGSCLTKMMEQFPKRCIDVGIAEGHSVTYAGGIARNGSFKVMVSIYSTFLQRALDNVYHDVCIQNLPVVFAIDRAGIAGGDGITHNGIYDIGFLNEMPNMIIAGPRDAQVLTELLHDCFDWKQPTAIRYPNLPTPSPKKEYMVRRPVGKGEVLSQGNTVCIVTLGTMASVGLELKELLKQLGYEATVIDPIFVKPLDEPLLFEALSSHHYLITIEEHSLKGGLASIMNSFVVQNGFEHLCVTNFGIPETFIHHGSHQELSQKLGLTAEQIYESLIKKEVFVINPKSEALK
ncbi:MAG: 1-deoxy-D-xylulose-5-phosphate synthase [Simkaniaceae bacterium]|nr:1-deoxy-D-xylulose-5-phosphate synthase [Simkaniaceae bacterium]